MAKNSQTQCCECVSFGAWHSSQCENPANMTHEGNHYCGIHNPIKKQQRRDAQKKASTKQQAEQESHKRLQKAAPEMLNLLKIAVENCKYPDWRLSPDWVLEADTTICKAEGRDFFGRDNE